MKLRLINDVSVTMTQWSRVVGKILPLKSISCQNNVVYPMPTKRRHKTNVKRFCQMYTNEFKYSKMTSKIFFVIRLRNVTSGQSYKTSTIVIYDSRVVPDLKIPHITTVGS